MQHKRKEKPKIGRNECIKLVCEVLVNVYGDTLVECDVDLEMAKKVASKLRPYLNMKQSADISGKDFKTWRSKFKCDQMGIDEP